MPTNRDELIELIGAGNLTALEAAGLRVVPVEATREMIYHTAATLDDVFDASSPTWEPEVIACHRTLLSANPFAPKE